VWVRGKVLTYNHIPTGKTTQGCNRMAQGQYTKVTPSSSCTDELEEPNPSSSPRPHRTGATLCHNFSLTNPGKSESLLATLRRKETICTLFPVASQESLGSLLPGGLLLRAALPPTAPRARCKPAAAGKGDGGDCKKRETVTKKP